jgi:hypothetical protein
MRLRAFVTAVALLWPVSVFSEDIPVGSFVGGNELSQVCSDGVHDGARGYCTGYVAGVADALMAVTALKANGLAIPSVCLPMKGQVEHGVAPDQVRDVVVQYLTAHPETRHQTAGGLALLALQAAFPCK